MVEADEEFRLAGEDVLDAVEPGHRDEVDIAGRDIDALDPIAGPEQREPRAPDEPIRTA